MKYCPECRAELCGRKINGTDRLVCSSRDCGFVHWNNPMPVVAGLVQRHGKYVLARGTNWPTGLYSVLTGFLESGETPEDAIRREIQEELGLAAEQVDLIGHYPLVQLNQLIIAYAAVASGHVHLNDEIADVRFVSPNELAMFDFGPLELTRDIVSQWLARRGA